MADDSEDKRPQIAKDIESQRIGHQLRVKDEATEHKERLDRLQSFINGPEYHNVAESEKGLLIAQLAQMQTLYHILLQRIAIHKASR